MSRPRLTEFVDASGNLCALKDPDGPASPWQLAKLNTLGMVSVEPHFGECEPLTKGEAAWLIEQTLRRTGE